MSWWKMAAALILLAILLTVGRLFLKASNALDQIDPTAHSAKTVDNPPATLPEAQPE